MSHVCLLHDNDSTSTQTFVMQHTQYKNTLGFLSFFFFTPELSCIRLNVSVCMS